MTKAEKNIFNCEYCGKKHQANSVYVLKSLILQAYRNNNSNIYNCESSSNLILKYVKTFAKRLISSKQALHIYGFMSKIYKLHKSKQVPLSLVYTLEES